ncbi:MAG: heme o synthase [Bacteroidota bacterium]|nr:heme o synthase [Bacteroidota bacterium]MDX5428935.1 heme o synthase [Bacteroidota bacterium]MDX5447994.1 heme o synthase [Bacteroidota bacterium]MDX5506615.1 heme o synthase [Bacteroidota bacterium]
MKENESIVLEPRAEGYSIRTRIQDYAQLTKVRLASSVVFSAIAGYLLGTDQVRISEMAILTLGGFLVTGAANGFNQVLERDRDALMRRTQDRPVATGRMSIMEALLFCTLLMLGGLSLLFTLNPMSAGFGALSIFLYTLIYTPMKAHSPWAVLIGAFPGAIPFMLGWVSATNDFDIESGTLFAIQFLWQFPHFWAIAWLAYDDYKRAGYFLLPGRKKSKSAAYITLVYSIWLVFVSIIPVFGFTGTLYLSIPAAILLVILGLYLVSKSWKLYRERTDKAARKLMLTSIMYLTLLQIIYVVDKFVS